MKHTQQARLDALHRMQSFMNDNADALGNVNKSTSRAALDDLLTSLAASAAAQKLAETKAAGATAEKNALREDLRLHHMQPIATIARATLAHTPLIVKLRLPAKSVNDSTLIGSGHAMADAAAQYTEVFLGEQLPDGFIAELRAAADGVRTAAVLRDRFQGQAVSATQAMEDQMALARRVVSILNALIVKQLKGQADLLAGWRLAKHARVKPGVPRGSTSVTALHSAPMRAAA